MALFQDLIPDVRVHIPEAPTFVVERSLLRGMREFCEETRAWRVSGEIDTTANQTAQSILNFGADDTEIVDIISVKPATGGAPLVPRTYAWLDENTTDWRNETAEIASRFVFDGGSTLRLIPTPATSGVVYYLRAAIKPTLDATVIDDMLLNKYSEVFIDGALSKLLIMPRKPWTDGKLAVYYEAKFRSAWPAARTEAADEFQTGVPRKVKYGGL